MRNLLKIMLSGLVVVIVLILPNDVSAQSCSGTITCCNNTATVCTDTAGDPCSSGPGCTCTTSCTDWDIPQTCGLNGARNGCQVNNGCGFAQGSCSYTAPPPPTCNNNGICEGGSGENSFNCADCIAAPACPDGFCNGSETSATCPLDCGSGGGGSPPPPTAPPQNGACGSCSGCYAPDPDPGPSSCANINGVCSKAGYCGTGGGGVPSACWIDGVSIAGVGTTGSNIRVGLGQTSPSIQWLVRASNPPKGSVRCRSFSFCTYPYLAGNATTPYMLSPGQTAKSGARPYYVNTITGNQLGIWPLRLYVPKDWDNNSGFPDGGPLCWRDFNVVVQVGSMTVTPSPVDTSVGSPTIVTADVTPLTGETVTSVEFIPDDVTVANATSPVTGANPYSSQVVGLRSGTFTRMTVIAHTTAGDITERVRINVDASSNTAPSVSITNPTTGGTHVAGTTATFTATATDPEDPGGVPAGGVEFFINGSSVGEAFAPTPAGSSNFEVPNILCPAGSVQIIARATDSDGAVGVSTPVDTNGVPPVAWWQVTGGNIITKGNVSSQIAEFCTNSPSCPSSLILDDPISARPGTVVYGGNSLDFSADTTNNGTASSTDWITNTDTASNIYNYAYFSSLASGRNFTLDASVDTTLNSGSFNSAPAGGEEYNWIRVRGNATINQPINISQKAILFVEGNLYINNTINLGGGGDKFFMAIVSRDIIVDPSVTSPDTTTPALTGIFNADGVFRTGTTGATDGLLVVNGSVACADVVLERDLEVGNLDTPAEHFIYSPELVSNYPSALSDKHLVWREVAP